MSQTAYHWTPALQRRFLEALAFEGSIDRACASVSKTRPAAYALRNRAEAHAFALGWDAAILIARARLADILMEAALEPIAFSPVRNPETGRIGWRRADPMLSTGMGMSLLRRLDRAIAAAERDGRGQAARIVAHDFAAFLDLVESGPAPSQVHTFVTTRREAADLRIHCILARKSALPASADDAALAQSSAPGHPQRRTQSGWRDSPAPPR